MALKVLGIGDNVVDKYLHSDLMYPGGNALNFAVYAQKLGAKSAFLGAFGDDEAAEHVQSTLLDLNVDIKRCRHYSGENGYACIKLVDGEREFVCSNKNGVLREHPLSLDSEDLAYISGFNLIHTSLNGYLESELEKIGRLGIPVSFDFSNRGSDDYFQQVCPWVDFGFISASALSEKETEEKIRLLHGYGCRQAIATRAEHGVYYFDGADVLFWQPTYVKPIDTLGAGDAFLTGFLLSALQASPLLSRREKIIGAMRAGGEMAHSVLHTHGAFGYGKPWR